MSVSHVLRWVTVPFAGGVNVCENVDILAMAILESFCVWECTADLGRALDGLERLHMCRGGKHRGFGRPLSPIELRLFN